MMKKTIKNLTLGMISLAMVGCGSQEANKDMDKNYNGGIDAKNMDLNASPKDDFYQYANGGWMDRTVIPDDQSRWGSFNELRDRNDSMTLKLVNKALETKDVDASSDEGKVINFFTVAMDTDKLNAEGITPIKSLLAEVDDIASKDDVLEFMIKSEPILGTLVGSYVGSDAKNSNYNALYLGGGNLGLPDRDFYTDETDDAKEKRSQYVSHIAKMLNYIDASDPSSQADRIMALETRMAQAMLTKVERRKPENTYNPKSLDELKTIAPIINWTRYYEGIGAKNFDQIIVSQPKYIAEVNAIMSEVPVSTLKEYLQWVVINDAAGYLSEDIGNDNFEFYGKILNGSPQQKPRNERVLGVTNRVLGEALGKLYVAEYFPSEAKETAVEMVKNIQKAYENRINNLDWMTADTKVKAIEKLYGMNVKIGFPDQWKDYSKLEVADASDGSYYQNILNSRKWGFDKKIGEIGKEVDKSEWFMSPQTVNAYYNPPYNEIVFPAAILQPPFFDFKADAAVNYGGMGAVIGHEISHGFDDQGAKYDVKGNLENWWTEEDLANFTIKGKQLVAQFDAYEPLPGVNVNGEFTLGENIGDLGGVASAYEGLQLYLADHGRPDDIMGFSPEKRFFINWATIWRTKFRDEALRNQIKTDPHSPGQYRAVGPLINVDGFYEAFDIQPGDKMYKAEEDRIYIW